MKPPTLFRRRADPVTLSIVRSGVLENVDDWGYEDREQLVRELKRYMGLYALDYMIWITIWVMLGTLAGMGICLLFGVSPNIPDPTFYLAVLVIAYFTSLATSAHILENYQRVLETIKVGEHGGY